MKTRKLVLSVMTLMLVIVFSACEKDWGQKPIEASESILPERFKVDIPSSLSNTETKSVSMKSANIDTLKGNAIYWNLLYFIAIGEGAADVVESIMWHIRVFDIQDVIELTYVSDDDRRTKHLEVIDNVNFDGRDWAYQLTITDIDSEENEDGGIAMQVFWNNSPVQGVAMIKPYNLDRSKNRMHEDAMYSVEYSETGLAQYDAWMKIGISGLTVEDYQLYGMNAIKMFVGKRGDMVDVYGNSSHPNAKFFTDEKGYNWTFVASGDKANDIAIAEVGIPYSTIDSDSREVILKDYSIKNVLTENINTWFLNTFHVRPDAEDLSGYLKNADAPGYFGNQGFIQGGTAPNNSYGNLEERIELLSPYSPKDVHEMTIEFK